MVSRARREADATRAASRRRAAALVSDAFSVQPCYHALVQSLIESGVWALDEAYVATAGTPVQPMAAAPAPSIEAAIKRLGGQPFLSEWKYDGERCQAHLLPPAERSGVADDELGEAGPAGGGPRVRLYSRSLDEMTSRFPELIEALPLALGGGDIEVETSTPPSSSPPPSSTSRAASAVSAAAPVVSAVLDGELCAIDEVSGGILPFQSLAARPRKAPTPEQLEAGPRVCLLAFDLLELNGRSLLGEPLRARRDLLRSVIRVVPHRVELAEGTEGSTEEDLREALDHAIDDGAEGLMVKALGGSAGAAGAAGAADDGDARSGAEIDGVAQSGCERDGGEAAPAILSPSTYEAGKRSLQWLKLKRDYIDGMGDSFDLVPIGAYFGKGKRAGVYGAYLLACFEPATQRWQPVCKIGSGFSDEQLARWSETAVEADEGGVEAIVDVGEGLSSALEPHVWLAPSVVWEVSAASVSVSPTYRAAFDAVADGKGLALRFPRLVRERPDKPTADATTAEQLAEIFRTQPQLASEQYTELPAPRDAADGEA